MSRLIGAVCWILQAALLLWFWPLMIEDLLSGRLDLDRRRNEYWHRRHGFNAWSRQFERDLRQRRKKKWKKRNDFYK